MANISILDWQAQYKNGAFNNPNRETQCRAGWYDWFCSDTSLLSRGTKMYKVVARLLNSSTINLNESYVFFKNNFPLQGGLYDSFSICSLSDQSVNFYISFGCPWDKKKTGNSWHVYDVLNNSAEPIFSARTGAQVANFLNNYSR